VLPGPERRRWSAEEKARIVAESSEPGKANILGKDEDWLHDFAVDVFPEDGCLRVYGVGEDGVTAFTEYGIECLQQIIATKELPETHRHRSNRPNSPACGPHRILTAHPVLAPDHRRRRSRQPRAATGSTDAITQPAVLTAGLLFPRVPTLRATQ
jgi:hypothetical protein